MARRAIIFLVFLALGSGWVALPLGAAPRSAQRMEQLQQLAADYERLENELAACRTRAADLATAGYGGTVLRRDLEVVAERVAGLREELAGLGRRLQQLKPGGGLSLPSFSLHATRQTYAGPPVSGPLRNGDILALQAEVGYPEAAAPVVGFLTWQLFNAEGEALPRYMKQEQRLGRDETHKVRLRYRLDGLPNGSYTAALTHQLANDPAVQVQASVGFEVYDPVRIHKLWVTDRPGGREHQAKLMSGELPHLYLAFALAERVETVDMVLEVRNRDTGETVYVFDGPYTRKPEQSLQRRGLRLGGEMVQAGDRLRVSARLKASGDRPVEAVADFQVQAYPLGIEAPQTLKAGTSRPFALQPPPEFTPPFTVHVDASGPVSAGYKADQLTGTVSAISRDNAQGRLRATVVDAQQRTATAEAAIRVQGKAQEAPAASQASKSEGTRPATSASRSHAPRAQPPNEDDRFTVAPAEARQQRQREYQAEAEAFRQRWHEAWQAADEVLGRVHAQIETYLQQIKTVRRKGAGRIQRATASPYSCSVQDSQLRRRLKAQLPSRFEIWDTLTPFVRQLPPEAQFGEYGNSEGPKRWLRFKGLDPAHRHRQRDMCRAEDMIYAGTRYMQHFTDWIDTALKHGMEHQEAQEHQRKAREYAAQVEQLGNRFGAARTPPRILPFAQYWSRYE
ncbi:hypothetical protein [Desulfohalobium retbaense]|uniref:hypothetical protein n=1 Tax=Desulfohalobium retbaense TaxID=45663 RepID=UPI0011D0FA63|nr:hypothetical protein [Desulfohalobium retbaense]